MSDSRELAGLGGDPRPVTLSAEDLARATGLSHTRLTQLVRAGLVETIHPGANEFAAAQAIRLRRMLRLHDDLGMSLGNAAIVVDLMDRLDELEARLLRLRSSE